MQVDDWTRWASQHLGHCLTPDQRAACQPSLLTLSQLEQLDNILVVGKIFGVQHDYLIAYGVNRTALDRPTKYFFRFEPDSWTLAIAGISIDCECVSFLVWTAVFNGHNCRRRPPLRLPWTF
jgi:hypothetical protein